MSVTDKLSEAITAKVPNQKPIAKQTFKYILMQSW